MKRILTDESSSCLFELPITERHLKLYESGTLADIMMYAVIISNNNKFEGL